MAGFKFAIDFDSRSFRAGTDQAADAVDALGEALADLEKADPDRAADGLSDVERAAQGAETAAEGAQAALDDVGRADTDRAASGLDEVADAADTAERAAHDVEAALDDAGRAGDGLDTVADDARDASTDLDRMADSVDDAADKTEELRRKFDDALDAAQKVGKEEVDIEVDIDPDPAKRNLDGFKDDLKASANQSGQEIAGTFTGGFDAENIADGITEILGEATENLSGPMQVAGLTAAAAFAIAYGELAKIAEATNEAKIAAGELAVEMGGLDDAGRLDALNGKFDELSTTLIDVRSWFEVWQSDAVTSIEAIAGAVEAGTLSAEQFNDAFRTTEPRERLAELKDVQSDLNSKLEEAGSLSWWEKLGASAAAAEGSTEQQKLLTESLSEGVQVSEDAAKAIDEMVAEQEKAVEIEEAQAAAAGLTVDEYRKRQEEIQRNTEANEAYADSLEATADPVSVYEDLLDSKGEADREAAQATADATKDATDSWEDYAKSAKVSVNELIDTWNEQAEQARKFERNLAIIAESGGQALADELRAKGPEVAGSVAAVIAEAGPAKRRAAIEAHATASGEEISEDMGKGVRNNKGAVQRGVNDAVNSVDPPFVSVPIEGDTSNLYNQLTAFRPPTVEVPIMQRPYNAKTGSFYP